MKKLAIGTWAYIFGPYESHPVDFETVVHTLSEIGFDAVSIAGFRPHILVDDYEGREKREQLLALLQNAGLAVAEFSPDPCGLNPVIDPAPYIERMKRNIRFLSQCGFPMLRLDTACPPILPENVSYQQAYDRTVETFRTLSDYAAAHDVQIVWEFEPGFLFNKPSEILSILQDVVGARQLGEQETLQGGVIEFMHMLQGRIGMVHLIDSDGTLHDDDTSTHAPFGTGLLDMDAIYQELLKPEIYSGDYISIDLCFWADAWDVTRRCYDYMRALQKKYGS